MPNRAPQAQLHQVLPILLSILVPLAGCGGGGEGEGHAGGGDHPRGGRGPGGDEKPVPVAVTEAVVGPIATYYEATASLEAEKEARILARIGGVVEVLRAEEGDLVAKGQTLLEIEDREFQLKVEQAAARTARVRSSHDRLREMLAEELASQEEYETARSELADAEAAEGLARLELGYASVTAPFAGRVTQRLVDPGQTLSAGAELFVLADFDPLLARVHVPAREFRQLQVEQGVELILDSTGERLRGRITLISPVVDPTTGTIKITVEVASYPETTRPGDFAQVRVVTELRPRATLVPRGAVVTEKGESVVFVAAGTDTVTAERRLVALGFTDEEHAEIVEGLAPGERIVVRGQRSLKPGAVLKILGEGGEEAADGSGEQAAAGRGQGKRAKGGA